jgi:hypothetical protein
MVSKEKSEISSWHICRNWIRNEKVVSLQSVHGQKVEIVPHPTLETILKTPKQSLYVLLPLEFKDEL